jgi:hypothetical protein
MEAFNNTRSRGWLRLEKLHRITIKQFCEQAVGNRHNKNELTQSAKQPTIVSLNIACHVDELSAMFVSL